MKFNEVEPWQVSKRGITPPLFQPQVQVKAGHYKLRYTFVPHTHTHNGRKNVSVYCSSYLLRTSAKDCLMHDMKLPWVHLLRIREMTFASLWSSFEHTSLSCNTFGFSRRLRKRWRTRRGLNICVVITMILCALKLQETLITLPSDLL